MASYTGKIVELADRGHPLSSQNCNCIHDCTLKAHAKFQILVRIPQILDFVRNNCRSDQSHVGNCFNLGPRCEAVICRSQLESIQ